MLTPSCTKQARNIKSIQQRQGRSEEFLGSKEGEQASEQQKKSTTDSGYIMAQAAEKKKGIVCCRRVGNQRYVLKLSEEGRRDTMQSTRGDTRAMGWCDGCS